MDPLVIPIADRKIRGAISGRVGYSRRLMRREIRFRSLAAHAIEALCFAVRISALVESLRWAKDDPSRHRNGNKFSETIHESFGMSSE